MTGASSGIGAATVRTLAASGLKVIATARRGDRLSKLAEENPLIQPFVADLTDATNVELLAEYARQQEVSIVIHAAGGAFDAASIADTEIESWL